MLSNLLLCASYEKDITPYKFNSTNIKVYSLEEALYHCYHYWKQSIDEFISDNFITWVNDELKLSFIGSEIKKLRNEKSFVKRLIGFLSIIYYFDEAEIISLEKELYFWENKREWEKLKEQADYLINEGFYEKAILFYKKALTFEETNICIINNIGIGYMKMEKYNKAVYYFHKAYTIDSSNVTVLFNLIEAEIYNNDFEQAEKYLQIAQDFEINSEVYYFYGELSFYKGNYRQAVEYYKKAIELNNDLYIVFKLVDLYVKLRKYDKAIEILESEDNTNIDVLIKKGEVYVNYNNIPAAIRCVEKALSYDYQSVKLWTMVARYYRLNYDLENAEKCIYRALNIDNNNENANLEFAKIRKSQGKLKEYQAILRSILNNFKRRYREIY